MELRSPAARCVILLAVAAGCRSATEPAPPTGPEPGVAVGGYHACALQASGKVYCWGANFYGQTGSGQQDGSDQPVAVQTARTFSMISAQAHGTCGISDGQILCWGRAPEGSGISASPVPVPIPTGPTVFASVSVGGYHACGLTADGLGYCWGANGSGELGNGTRSASTAPVAVAGGYRFAALSAGSLHTCGLTTAGAALCWGSNEEGQLGIGSREAASVPTPVAGSHRFASVSSGNRHSCGVDADGAMYCWGQNLYGQLGDGTQERRLTPVAVAGSIRFRFGTGRGGYQSCGLAMDGQAYCWGGNEAGQIGDGTTTPRLVPQPVAGGHRFASLDISAQEACGVTLGGEFYCWGENDDGELGVGGTENRLVPTRVSVPED